MPDIKSLYEIPSFMHIARHGGQFITGKVLHVGAGPRRFGQNFPGEWTTCDIRPVADDYADAHKLPYEDGSYDTVVCVNMLGSCAAPILVMKEMFRVLKPGGHLILTVEAYPRKDKRLWGIGVEGVVYLCGAAGFELLTEPIPDGKPISGAFQEFAHHVPFTPLSADMLGGWLSQMDNLYPSIVYTVARKPE